MSLHLIKTDNASIVNKVALRKRAVESLDKLRVLDLYAGNNILWSYFDKEKYYGVEIQKGKGKNITADCKKLIDSLDLSAFNIIDCDSYGVPFDVIYKLFNNKTLKDGTIIIYTAISNRLSGISRQCLDMFNLKKIYDKCHNLITEYAFELFYAMLYDFGVKEVSYMESIGNFTKHYGYFTVNGLTRLV